jgi:hypothetical protein
MYCLHHQGDGGCSTYLWNVGLLQGDYMALHSRRLWSSYFPPWEPEISHCSYHLQGECLLRGSEGLIQTRNYVSCGMWRTWLVEQRRKLTMDNTELESSCDFSLSHICTNYLFSGNSMKMAEM